MKPGAVVTVSKRMLIYTIAVMVVVVLTLGGLGYAYTGRVQRDTEAHFKRNSEYLERRLREQDQADNRVWCDALSFVDRPLPENATKEARAFVKVVHAMRVYFGCIPK